MNAQLVESQTGKEARRLSLFSLEGCTLHTRHNVLSRLVMLFVQAVQPMTDDTHTHVTRAHPLLATDSWVLTGGGYLLLPPSLFAQMERDVFEQRHHRAN